MSNVDLPGPSRIVLISGTVLMAVFDALKDCLNANAIAAVKVSINDQHYVTEGARHT